MSDCEHEITAKCRFLDFGESIVTLYWTSPLVSNTQSQVRGNSSLFWAEEAAWGCPAPPPPTGSWPLHCCPHRAAGCSHTASAVRTVHSDCSYSPEPLSALRSTGPTPGSCLSATSNSSMLYFDTLFPLPHTCWPTQCSLSTAHMPDVSQEHKLVTNWD